MVFLIDHHGDGIVLADQRGAQFSKFQKVVADQVVFHQLLALCVREVLHADQLIRLRAAGQRVRRPANGLLRPFPVHGGSKGDVLIIAAKRTRLETTTSRSKALFAAMALHLFLQLLLQSADLVAQFGSFFIFFGGNGVHQLCL